MHQLSCQPSINWAASQARQQCQTVLVWLYGWQKTTWICHFHSSHAQCMVNTETVVAGSIKVSYLWLGVDYSIKSWAAMSVSSQSSKGDQRFCPYYVIARGCFLPPWWAELNNRWEWGLLLTQSPFIHVLPFCCPLSNHQMEEHFGKVGFRRSAAIYFRKKQLLPWRPIPGHSPWWVA